MFYKRSKNETESLRSALSDIQNRADLLDVACGVGLWEGVLVNGESAHPESKWRWSSELRRLLGFIDETDFPDIVESWADRIHPQDKQATFDAFARSLEDKTGTYRYTVAYRLQTKTGDYRWFRASGGCIHQADGTIRACGSLVDVEEQILMVRSMEQSALEDELAVSELSRALAALADGDLTYRIERTDFPAKATALKTNFNLAASKLTAVLNIVSASVRSIAKGTAEITQASDNISRRTERQAASLEETASALEEITATVRTSASNTAKVSNITTTARSTAEHSGTIVSSAILAMSEIENSSRQIGEIIGVIDEISFQTNLLALNAGVEAARAGDSGKGFAVVAHEVRELAQRAATAAKEIKILVSASSRQVGQGVKLVDSTGETLATIIESIKEIAGSVTAIASSSHQQSAGLQQINAAVNEIDHMTQQNSAMVEETTAASHALKLEAEHLSDQIAHFKLPPEREQGGKSFISIVTSR